MPGRRTKFAVNRISPTADYDTLLANVIRHFENANRIGEYLHAEWVSHEQIEQEYPMIGEA